MLFLESAKVLGADLRVRLHPGQLEPLAKPSFAQAVAYLEHGAPDCSGDTLPLVEREGEHGEDGERERRRHADYKRNVPRTRARPITCGMAHAAEARAVLSCRARRAMRRASARRAREGTRGHRFVKADDVAEEAAGREPRRRDASAAEP